MTTLKSLMQKHNLKRKDISTLLNMSLRTVDAWLTNKKSGRTMSPQMMELLIMKIKNKDSENSPTVLDMRDCSEHEVDKIEKENPNRIILTYATAEESKAATERALKKYGNVIINLAKK